MRRIGRKAVGLGLLAGGVVLALGEVGAAGKIDTTEATLEAGSAPVPGTVTLDASADLSTAPRVDIDWGMSDENPIEHQTNAQSFLGGPAFHATTDTSFPQGTYDFGSLKIDSGVTVTFTGHSQVFVAGAAHIEGRLVISQPDSLNLLIGGDLTMIGRSGTLTTGLYAQDGSYTFISVGGRLDVSAVDGASVEIGSGVGGPGTIDALMSLSCDSAGTSRLSHAVLDAVAFDVKGDLEISDCTGRYAVGVSYEGATTVRRVTMDGLRVWAGNDVSIEDADCGYLDVTARPYGAIRIGGTSAIGAVRGTMLTAHGDVTVDDSVALTGPALMATSIEGKLALGSGTSVWRSTTGGPSTASPWGVVLFGKRGVTLAGSLTGGDVWNEVVAEQGDVELKNGASIDTPLGYLWLHAGGSVVASGGTSVLRAAEFDLRADTGDLDLDLASMTATSGPIVALTNGTVRLRGTYSAGRDVQILSRRDSIDVSGATLETSDAGAALSGFVRLATHSSNASIDASNATLRTGSSDVQSGDVLLQVAKSGGQTTKGVMKVSRVTARRSAEGVVTRIKGTMSGRGGKLDFLGSGVVTAGSTSRRVFLRGSRGRLRAAADAVEVQVTGGTSSSARFTLEIRERAATEGEPATLRFDRAGFHAQGTFRRPRVR